MKKCVEILSCISAFILYTVLMKLIYAFYYGIYRIKVLFHSLISSNSIHLILNEYFFILCSWMLLIKIMHNEYFYSTFLVVEKFEEIRWAWCVQNLCLQLIRGYDISHRNYPLPHVKPLSKERDFKEEEGYHGFMITLTIIHLFQDR